MPENKSRPPQEQPWENGWAPDTSRAPGTRRLWLAGALAVATVVACVTAIAVNDHEPEGRSDAREGQTLSDDESADGLISFASPSASSTTPGGKKGDKSTPSSGSPSASASASPSAEADDASPTPHTSAKPSASPGRTRKPSDPVPSSYQRSVQSVNYPDRYWHLSSGLIKLDAPRGSESREDSTFTVVKGLAKSSCYSFIASNGTYVRHRDFILRAERNDGTSLFQQDATFCAVPSPYSGAVMLQSVNYPNYCLRHSNFQLRLDPYGYNTTNRQDFSFRFVSALG